MSDSIFQKVKENHIKLSGCRRHLFNKDLTPKLIFNKTWECQHCGGYVSSDAKSWYEDGLKHAKQS